MLKDCCDYTAKPLCHIINLSLVTTTVPSERKKARVIPLYKSGPVYKPENYQPISILPFLSKLLERAFQEHIRDYLEGRSLISKFQFGYQPNCPTEHATILLTDEIRFEANDEKLVTVLFSDLSEAFDTINHSVLLNKLKAYGIDNEKLEWFTSYLFSRSQVFTLITNDQMSFISIVESHKDQYLRFYCFSYHDTLEKSEVLMDTDDTIIHDAHSDINVIEKVLHEEMSYRVHYLYQNELTLNLKK